MHNKKATPARIVLIIVTRPTCIISFSQAFALCYFEQPDVFMVSIWELLHSVQVLLACYGRNDVKQPSEEILAHATELSDSICTQLIENQYEITVGPFQHA